jgi:hypothetical protein
MDEQTNSCMSAISYDPSIYGDGFYVGITIQWLEKRGSVETIQNGIRFGGQKCAL